MSERLLRSDAEAIWRAGVAAVDSERLVRDAIRCDGETLTVCGHSSALDALGRIVVVGGGKAGAGMAAGVEAALGRGVVEERVTGWVNVPADCVRPLERVHLHAARPAGVNEPTSEGVTGTRTILEMVSQLGANDVCLVLISGGGSALLPAPVAAITLEDKQAVTRLLMRSGATIQEMNTVRKQLSQIKGGGLSRACSAGTLIALIISDVIGDPLDVIASGPTVDDNSTAGDALAVLRKFAPGGAEIPTAVVEYLQLKAANDNREGEESQASAEVTGGGTRVFNHVIGSNRVAIEAAARRAKDLGYTVRSLGCENQGEARDAGAAFVELCRSIRDRGEAAASPVCVLSGGEPVVKLVPCDRPRKGGRNQEFVLAAVERMWDDGLRQIAILSGGTDGEDGPTDAAGAVADAALIERARSLGLRTQDYLSINNSYPFFEAAGGLLKTGPTHTNVMDLRVGVIGG